MFRLLLLFSALPVLLCTDLSCRAQQNTDSANSKTEQLKKPALKPGDLPLEDVLPPRAQVVRTEEVIREDTEGMRSARLARLQLADYPKFFAAARDTTGSVTVTIRAYATHDAALRLISIDGQPLGTLWIGTLTKGIDDYMLDTSGIAAGTYFLSLEDREGNRFHTIKLVVQ